MMAEVAKEDVEAAGWRIRLGAAMFGFSIALPVIGMPLIAAMGLPGTTVATLSGAMLVTAEVLGLASIAVMGKTGYAYIKNRIFGFLKQYGPPDEVSDTRYTIGLVMFSVPILFGWIAPYASDWIPGYSDSSLTYAIIGDLVLLISVFVLGGDFWDKLRALFVNGARAQFPRTDA